MVASRWRPGVHPKRLTKASPVGEAERGASNDRAEAGIGADQAPVSQRSQRQGGPPPVRRPSPSPGGHRAQVLRAGAVAYAAGAHPGQALGCVRHPGSEGRPVQLERLQGAALVRQRGRQLGQGLLRYRQDGLGR